MSDASLAALLIVLTPAACSSNAEAPAGPASTTSAPVAQAAPAPASTASSTTGDAAPPPAVRLRSFEAPEHRGAQIRGDGRVLAAWHGAPIDGEPRLAPIELWDFSAGASVRLLPPPKPESPVPSILEFFWARDRHVLAANAYYGIAVWDLSKPSLNLEEWWPEALAALSPSRDRLLLADQVGHGGVLELQRGAKTARSTLYGNGVTGATHGLSWMGDAAGAIMAADEVVFLDAGSGAIRRRVQSGSGQGDSPIAAASAKGDVIALGYPDGRVVVLDGKSLATKVTLARASSQSNEPSDLAIASLALRPNGESVAAVRKNGALVIWEVSTRVEKLVAAASGCLTETYDEPVFHYSPDGARFACKAGDSWLLWDAKGKEEPKRLADGKLWWLDGGARLAIAGKGDDGEEVSIWDASTGERRSTQPVAESKDRHASFSDDFAYRVTVPSDVRVERLRDGRAIRLRALTKGGAAVAIVYTEQGLFSGDDEACNAVLARAGPSNEEMSPTPADCAERRRPDLAADFFAGK